MSEEKTMLILGVDNSSFVCIAIWTRKLGWYLIYLHNLMHIQEQVAGKNYHEYVGELLLSYFCYTACSTGSVS